jgi:hypothetical protein
MSISEVFSRYGVKIQLQLETALQPGLNFPDGICKELFPGQVSTIY